MFDTMTLTKTALAFCGTFLIFLLGKWVAEELYHVGGGGHGDHHAQAYVIETGGDEAAEPEEEIDFATLMASADASKGERLFSKCKACHKLESGANATGPYLFGVVGRPIDSAQGFKYSGALEVLGDIWSPEALNTFLENPKGAAPGTTMSFTGLKKPEERANMIAYLDTIK